MVSASHALNNIHCLTGKVMLKDECYIVTVEMAYNTVLTILKAKLDCYNLVIEVIKFNINVLSFKKLALIFFTATECLCVLIENFTSAIGFLDYCLAEQSSLLSSYYLALLT